MTLPLQIVQADRDLTTAEARALTGEIRSNVAELELKIVQAYQGRAWLVLGYDTWDAYVHGEFKRAPLALPREERQAAVQSLRGWGLSTRAIASVTGTGQTQIRRDSQVSLNGSPTPVTGRDGKTYNHRKTQPKPSPPTPQPTAVCPSCGGTGRIPQ